MPYGRCRSALMAARPLARNRADEPQREGPAPNAQPPGHGCPDFRALWDRSQQSVEHLPARVTHDREAWSAVASELALQRSLDDDRPAGQPARLLSFASRRFPWRAALSLAREGRSRSSLLWLLLLRLLGLAVAALFTFGHGLSPLLV